VSIPWFRTCGSCDGNPLTYPTYFLSNARNKSITLPPTDEFAVLNAAPAGECAL
jgi:hypothetical protein